MPASQASHFLDAGSVSTQNSENFLPAFRPVSDNNVVDSFWPLSMLIESRVTRFFGARFLHLFLPAWMKEDVEFSELWHLVVGLFPLEFREK
jgi:hypothetical protein